MNIVAFAGRIKSGKDTAADFLVELHGYKRMAFADNLKQMCMHVFGLTDYQCYTQAGKERKLTAPIKATASSVHEIAVWLITENYWKVTEEMNEQMKKVLVDRKFSTPREILQFIGTEVLRECVDDDFHAKVLRNIIDAKGYNKVVISDCRFPNEAKAVKEWGGKVINIIRPLPEGDYVGIKDHASENALKDYKFDYEVDNSSTLEDFKGSVFKQALGEL